jgi:putative ABC transport system permease protein
MPDLFRRFIALVSRLAPRWARREFRAEWEAELSAAWTSRADPSWRTRGAIALRAAGSIADAWYLFRQQWSLDMVMQDVRYALRLVQQRPGYAALVILMLAIGIGANTAVFDVIDGVLLRPLPFRDPSSLVMVWENDRINRKPRYPVAPANYRDWADQTRTIQPMAAFIQGTMNLTGAGEPVRLHSTVATARLFDVLGVPPALGRTFTDADAVPPRHRVAVLSDRVWQQRFGSDPAIVGRRITLEGNAYEVIGVMPRGFAFPDRDVDLWRPAAISPQVLQTRATHFFSVVGRLAPGATLDAARTDFEAVALRLQRQYPATNDQRDVTIVPLHEQVVGDVRQALYLLAAAVALMLLIGCANVANLMLVRATSRRRELAVRAALGADRARLVRQMVIEGLVLAGGAGLVGVPLAAWLTSVLSIMAADYLPRASEIHLHFRVLLFATILSMGTGVLFALAPGWLSSQPDVQEALRQGTRGAGARPAARRLRSILVIAELAIAVALLVAAALVARSFVGVLRVEPGFSTDHVVTGSIALPGSRYGDDAPVIQYYETLLARVRGLPGVRAAGAVNALPLDGSGPTAWIAIEGMPSPAGEPPEVNYRAATPGYFEAMAVPIVAGRGFNATDNGELKVAIVNRVLAERFFGGANPIARRIRLGPNPKAPWRTIVGVVADIHEEGPDLPARPQAYLPLAQDAFSDMTLAVRADDDPAALRAAMAAVVRSIDRDVPLSRIRSLDEVLQAYVAPRRLAMLLLAAFAGVALLLSALGVAGVMAYTVSQRTNEIGVRMALGAQRSEILRMVLREGARLGASGLALGIGLSLGTTRLLGAWLFGVTATDAPTFAAVAAFMLVISLIACYLPARRAAGVDPLSAIRTE